MLMVVAIPASAAMGPGTAAPVTDRPIFDIPRMENVVIDGKADDWGEGGFQVNLLSPLTLSWLSPHGHNLPAADNHEPRFRLGWDNDGLLFLATVRDDAWIEQDDINMLWQFDGIELFLASEPGAKDFCQWVLSPGMTADHKQLRWKFHENRKSDALKKLPADILAARRPSIDGKAYTLEARLPWSALGIKPKEGLVVGLQVKFNEFDDTEEHTIAVPWFPHPHTYADSSRTHRVRLAEKASPSQSLIAWLREHWSAQRRFVLITAPDTMAGKQTTVSRAGKVLATGVLEKKQLGYARAYLKLHDTPLDGSPEAYTVQAGGVAPISPEFDRAVDNSGWPDKPDRSPQDEQLPACFWRPDGKGEPPVGDVISDRGCQKATYGTGNKIITHEGKVHVAWLDSTEEGYFDRIRTLDQETGLWSPTYTLGSANGDHGRPALTLDSRGYLHTVYGVHHNDIPYRRSVRPNDASEWTEEILFGESLSYPTLVCGPDDTLYLTGRYGWEGVRMYVKPLGKDWEDRGLIVTGDEGIVSYAAFHSGMAWSPDHKVLHFSTSTYQSMDENRWGMIQSANYMRSLDFGKTWQKADGSPIKLPATSETMDVFVRQESFNPCPGIWNLGALVVDSKGNPYVLYSHYNMKPRGQVFLVTPDAKGRWQHLPLQAALDKHAPGWVVMGFRGGLTMTEDDVIHIALQLVPWDHPAALREQAHWRYPSLLGYSTNAVSARFSQQAALTWCRENPKQSATAWFESRDQGKTFTPRTVLSHNPDIVYNQPSFEIPTGFNKIPAGSSPAIVYFTGRSMSGADADGKEEVVDNKVYFIRGDRR
jgi:hypothetical protein